MKLPFARKNKKQSQKILKSMKKNVINLLSTLGGSCKLDVFVDKYTNSYGKIPTHPQYWTLESVIKNEFKGTVKIDGGIISVKKSSAVIGDDASYSGMLKSFL